MFSYEPSRDNFFEYKIMIRAAVYKPQHHGLTRHDQQHMTTKIKIITL